MLVQTSERVEYFEAKGTADLRPVPIQNRSVNTEFEMAIWLMYSLFAFHYLRPSEALRVQTQRYFGMTD